MNLLFDTKVTNGILDRYYNDTHNQLTSIYSKSGFFCYTTRTYVQFVDKY